MNYDQAAQKYKKTDQFNNAIRCFEELIKINDKLNDNWAMAKNYENIIEC